MANKKWKAFFSDYILLICVVVCYGSFIVSPSVGIYDWVKELAYFQFIQDSYKTHDTLPFWWWNRPLGTPYPAINHTSLFIANPETFMFSPFIWLSLYLDPVKLIKVLTLIHILIGISGIYFLSERVGWTESQRRIFFIGFMLSPFLMQHMTIGYTPWLNVMFFPWLVYYWAKPSVTSWVCQGAVYALILLQGGTHVCAWFFSFFVIWEFCIAIRERSVKNFLIYLGLLVPIGLLAAVRIIPTWSVFNNFKQSIEPGYSLTSFVEWALLPPSINHAVKNYSEVVQQVPTWDGAHFWWLVLPMFILLSAKCVWDRHTRSPNNTLLLYYPETLAVTIWILLLISFGDIFASIIGMLSEYVVNVEILGSLEKYPYRWAVPAYFAAVLFISDFGKFLSTDYLTSDLFQIFFAGPLVWACLSWSSLAVSVDPEQHALKKVKRRVAIEVDPKNAVIFKESEFSPKQLKFQMTDSRISKVVVALPHVPARDSEHLVVKGSGQLRSAEGANYVELVTQTPQRLRLEVDRDNLWSYPIRITIASWLTLMIFQVIARVIGAE